MLVRIGLWVVAAVDVFALVYLLVVLAPGADAFRFAVWFLAAVLLAAQAGTVLLALRWRACTMPAPRPSLPAFAVLVLAFLVDVMGVSGAAFNVASVGYRLLGLATLAWTLANTAVLVAAWRWRPWARASPVAGQG